MIRMNSIIRHLGLGLILLPLLVGCLAGAPQSVQAEESDYLEPSATYSQEELAQMLAPIALYPDALLSQVLMASTYPIEVVEADRWIQRNPGLTGESLDDQLMNQDWDPSVKAVCHFPSILALMSERITETTQLGNAFLAQEDKVMDMVQELRSRAYAQSNLTSTSEQKVRVERDTIIIEPADPRVIYVPYYDPFYVYGPWWYPAYPPYYWGPENVNVGIGISYWPGFSFGFTFGTWSYFDWPRRSIFIDVHKRPRFVRPDRWGTAPGYWQHAPSHRRGVVYRDSFTARKYGQFPPRAADLRRDSRPVVEIQERKRDGHFTEGAKIRRDEPSKARLDLERKERDRTDRDKQDRQRVDRDNQEQERQVQEGLERNRLEAVKLESNRKEQERTDRDRRDKQQREQADRDRTRVERVQVAPAAAPAGAVIVEPPQADFGKSERQRLDRNNQDRQRDESLREQLQRNQLEQVKVDNANRERERIDRSNQDRQRDEALREQLQRNQLEQMKVDTDNRERERIDREKPKRNPVSVEKVVPAVEVPQPDSSTRGINRGEVAPVTGVATERSRGKRQSEDADSSKRGRKENDSQDDGNNRDRRWR